VALGARWHEDRGEAIGESPRDLRCFGEHAADLESEHVPVSPLFGQVQAPEPARRPDVDVEVLRRVGVCTRRPAVLEFEDALVGATQRVDVLSDLVLPYRAPALVAKPLRLQRRWFGCHRGRRQRTKRGNGAWRAAKQREKHAE